MLPGGTVAVTGAAAIRGRGWQPLSSSGRECHLASSPQLMIAVIGTQCRRIIPEWGYFVALCITGTGVFICAQAIEAIAQKVAVQSGLSAGGAVCLRLR